MSRPTPEHGTTTSYVVGFVLSLICTAIPYYLVVNKLVFGNVLLATVIGFSIIQMIIQIVFFLHIGRGRKPLYNITFFVFTLGLILVVVGGSLFIIGHLRYNMVPSEVSKNLAEKEGIYQVEGQKTGACQDINANHHIIISSGKLSTLHTEAQLCDTLTFINEDTEVHEITFGTHHNPGTYAGEAELLVRKGRNKTINLNQSGTYHFYDQRNPEITGSFTVTPE